MSDRTPSDEPISPEPTAERKPEDQEVNPLVVTEELGTPEPSSEGLFEEERPAPKPIVISTTPKPIVISSTPKPLDPDAQPSSLTEARRFQAKKRIDERREEGFRLKGGMPLWVWGAAGLLLILAIVFLASRGSDEGPGDSAGDGGGAGVLEADGTDLLSLGAGKSGTAAEDLRKLEGETVSGEGVKVQSIVGDEGFWVGANQRKRFFVFLAIEGESGPKVRVGDLLDLTGELQPVPLDFKDRFGVGKSSGSEQLEAQGLYLELTEAPAIR